MTRSELIQHLVTMVHNTTTNYQTDLVYDVEILCSEDRHFTKWAWFCREYGTYMTCLEFSDKWTENYIRSIYEIHPNIFGHIITKNGDVYTIESATEEEILNAMF